MGSAQSAGLVVKVGLALINIVPAIIKFIIDSVRENNNRERENRMFDEKHKNDLDKLRKEHDKRQKESDIKNKEKEEHLLALQVRV